MNASLLAAVLALVSVATGVLAGSGLLALVWPTVSGAVPRLRPQTRTAVLMGLRLLPAVTGALLALVVVTAFLAYEPAAARETLGVALAAGALGGAALLVEGAARGIRSWRGTQGVLRAWTPQPSVTARDVAIIDARFPVVAIAGVRRPRLIIARRVLEACDRQELDAVIAHETAHLMARDNLTRLLFSGAPGWWIARRLLADIERAWVAASEEAADDHAARTTSPIVLAAALAKIARLALDTEPPPINVSAVFSGEGVEHRIRRLLEARPAARDGRSRMTTLLLPLTLGAAVASIPLQRVYDIVEFCVQHLP